MSSEKFTPSEAIRNPEGLHLLELPKANEEVQDVDIEGGKAEIIRPKGFEGFEAVIGTRIGDPDEEVWDKSVFYQQAKLIIHGLLE